MPDPTAPRPRALAPLARAHDAVTYAGFVLGVAALALIVVLFSYEIVARYFFRAPTRWSSDYVSYALLISTFLVLPQLTRMREYIAITFVQESLPGRFRLGLNVALLVLSGIVCLAAGYLCTLETLRQFRSGTYTMAVAAVPKWAVSGFIAYGLVNSGLYFLRSAAADIARGPATVPAGGRAG